MRHITLSKLCIFSTLMIMNNSYTMKSMTSTKKKLLVSIQMTTDVALGKIPRRQMNYQVPPNSALQSIPLQNITQQNISQSQMITQTIDLSAQPKDREKKIMRPAIMRVVAESLSLQVAAHTINSLAQENHSFNDHINNPINCLDLIKTLAKRFNCADMTVCEALKTKQAKIQSNLQWKLYKLCTNEIGLTHGNTLPLLTNLTKDGTDFNFSYEPDQSIPLTICIYGDNVLAYLLLDMPQVDLELADAQGITPLIAARDLYPPNLKLVKPIEDAIAKKRN